ncbi:molybdopterin-dependent oxidoreductase [Spirosoma spitsbergense]|uniref:molybdopterin-dependent oxidoreductase n=1 Tax=Spirosoma spitsbergense TaxID=431554 RepID=UPI000360D456|nr:molybdopterin-dependent oxidoreductase [Spirosoma spitsbergense]
MNNRIVSVRFDRWIYISLIAILYAVPIRGRAQTALTISGDVTKPVTLQEAEVKNMPHTEVTAKDHDGNEHRYAGVALVELLKQAGTTLGGELRGKNLRKFVLVKGADAYEVLFALPELDPEFATQTILLADAVDGAPFVPGVGPYRLVVPDEKRATRWVRNVKAIEVRLAP